VDERPEQQMMIDRAAAEQGRTLDYHILADPDHAVGIDSFTGRAGPAERRSHAVPGTRA